MWLIRLASQHKAKLIETALKKADFLITSTTQTHSHSHFCWNTRYPDSPLSASLPPPPVSPPWPEHCSRPGLGSQCVSSGPRWWSGQQPALFPVSLFPSVFPCLGIKKSDCCQCTALVSAQFSGIFHSIGEGNIALGLLTRKGMQILSQEEK